MYRGCPRQDPPVCHRVQDDSVAERQPCACGWCVSCHLVSAFDGVGELLLCDGVLHCVTLILQTNCDSCVMWHVGILTPLLDDKRRLASLLSFPTPDVIRRISSPPVVHSEPLQLSFRLKQVIRHACLQASFRKLTVRLLTFSASAVVLAPSFCFVCCLWPLSQQPPSRLVSTAASLSFDSTASFAAIVLASSAAWYC